MNCPTDEVVAWCVEVGNKATKLFGVDLSSVELMFDLDGEQAAIAGCLESIESRQTWGHYIRFNIQMLKRADERIMNVFRNEVVPHEVAHLVCYKRPDLGADHDAGWMQICHALGGNGKRMVYIPTEEHEYEYTTDLGVKVRVNERRHRLVQDGGTLHFSKVIGSVTSTCPHVVVGTKQAHNPSSLTIGD